eukprot:GHRR01018891.1.p1 GENE.GHRR01018891.1~~GHRR01018891.1.p1  ORF type:complete len:1346 (+),score=395.98 GHRR01018891.1:182-4219(+)
MGRRTINLGALQLIGALLTSSLAAAQQPSDQLALAGAPTEFQLHNYSLDGQTLYTACPCKSRWTFTLPNNSVAALSGCANPANDSAGPFCEVNDAGTLRCPAGETLRMDNGGRRMRVVPCLPQRQRTLAGCLCSPYWSERNDIDLKPSWPIMPRALMLQGLHQGWLMAGNCSAALNLPGGSRCTVTEGTCTTMPNKAFPPPTPNLFWQILSSDSQGWDFCKDPAYDSQRAQQPGGAAAALAALPVNLRNSIKYKTQAGCECSPLNWTYYPSVNQNAGQPLNTFLGCANPDSDPLGNWCPVDPHKCPSLYGAKQPDPGDVPPSMMNRVYFDYCGEVRNRTQAGCLCMGYWKATFNSSQEAKPGSNGLVPDPSRSTVYSKGKCANPANLQRERPWCYVDYLTCDSTPEGKADPKSNELYWDFCGPNSQPLGEVQYGPDSAIPAAAPPSSGGVYVPEGFVQLPHSPTPSQTGIYVPVPGGVQPAAPALPPGSTTTEAANGSAPSGSTAGTAGGSTAGTTTGSTPATEPSTSTQSSTHLSEGPAAAAATSGTTQHSPHVAVIVVPILVGILVIAAIIAGFLLLRQKRHRRDQKKLRQRVLGWDDNVQGNGAGVQPSTHGPADAESGRASFMAAGLGYKDSAYHGWGNGGQGSRAADSSYASSVQGSQIPLVKHAGHPISYPYDPDQAANSAGRGPSETGAAAGGTQPNSFTRPLTGGSDAVKAAAAAVEANAASLANKWGSSAFDTFGSGNPGSVAGSGQGGISGDSGHSIDWARWSAAGGSRAGAVAVIAAEQQRAAAGNDTKQQRDAGNSAMGNGNKAIYARLSSSPFADKGALLPKFSSVAPAADFTGTGPPGTNAWAAGVPALSSDLLSQIHLQKAEAQDRVGELPCRPPTVQTHRTLTPDNPSTPSHEVPGAGVNPIRPGSRRFSWAASSVATGPASSIGEHEQETQLSGLTGMTFGDTSAGSSEWNAQSKGVVPTGAATAGVTAGAAAAAEGSNRSADTPRQSSKDAAVLAMQHSVAPSPHRFMSGTYVDPGWDFERAKINPVRVLLQVEDEPGTSKPVTLLLMVSAPPPRPDVLAQIVLPKDPPQAGVDLCIDAVRDLSFPSNSFLGQGAFGQVHRALYKGMHPVAVKMLTDPDLRSADAETLRSFREELSIMAKLLHPNILRCYGGNLEGANPFIVTELCECGLDKMIGHYKRKYGTGLPLKATLTVGLHVASALWFLHPSIVHRDLKPQNVLLDLHGTAKVADFGLSRMKTHTFVSTRHIEAGTASYMAPECFGNTGVGEKVDVYALGMLLWECVMGERPWRGCNLVQVAFQVRTVALLRTVVPVASHRLLHSSFKHSNK